MRGQTDQETQDFFVMFDEEGITQGQRLDVMSTDVPLHIELEEVSTLVRRQLSWPDDDNYLGRL